MTLEQLYAVIACGNQEAHEWLILWNAHCQRIDDIIDEKNFRSEDILHAFVAAQDLVLHPFFLKHKAALYPLHILSANAYADSNNWSGADKPWCDIADVLRSYGNQMMLLVAAICAAPEENVWEKLRKLSPEIHKLSYATHHTKEGEPC